MTAENREALLVSAEPVGAVMMLRGNRHLSSATTPEQVAEFQKDNPAGWEFAGWLYTAPPSASSTAGEAEELARCKSSRERWIAMSCEFEHRLETLRSSLWSIVEHWKRRADESEYGPAYASCADEIKAELIDDAATPPSASSTAGVERAALREIIAVLGPKPPSGLSSGAEWEWAKALQVAKSAYATPSASSSAAAGAVSEATMHTLRKTAALPDNAGWIAAVTPQDARAILAAIEAKPCVKCGWMEGDGDE